MNLNNFEYREDLSTPDPFGIATPKGSGIESVLNLCALLMLSDKCHLQPC
jgi:hypothetical protein